MFFSAAFKHYIMLISLPGEKSNVTLTIFH